MHSPEMTQLPIPPKRMSYDDVTTIFERLTDGNLECGFVPGYHFKILNELSEEVGHLNFRVGDTEHVRFAAGHIGFEVAERYQGHRYAGSACLAVAPWVSEVSGSVLITVDPGNLPSIRTIERIGGDFLDEVDVPEGDPHHLRGSFRKIRYLWNPAKIEGQSIYKKD